MNEAEITAVERHGTMHSMGLCICPCFDALMKLARSLPERDTVSRLEGALAVVTAPEDDEA